MKIEELKNIIRDQAEEIKEKFENEYIVPREVGNNELLKSNVLVITGIRRAGKSILAHLLFKDKKYAYINFDDERLFGIKTQELNKILEAFYQLYGEVRYIILDEPQNVIGWELFVNRLQKNKKVIITGSNAKLLSKELATHLTGRYIDVTLYPFSFREFLVYKKYKPDLYLTSSIAQTKRFLSEYMEIGGLPESVMVGRRYVLKLYEDIINKDIISRYRIKYVRTLKELTKYLVSNFSSEFTYHKLKKFFDIKSVHTIKNYIDFLEISYLIFKLERFSYKLKEQVLAPKKIYVVDPGIANVGFRFSKDYGRLMENVVAIELMRQKALNPLYEIYYWKDYQQHEVDFVIKQNLQVKGLIQVCYNLEDYITRERETNSLVRASKELRCKNLLIITDEYESEEIINKKRIMFIPLWKWLLEIPQKFGD